MTKRAISILAACLVAVILAPACFAQTFTDIDSPQFEGKTNDKKRNSTLDANFALLEEGVKTNSRLVVTDSATIQTNLTVNGAQTNATDLTVNDSLVVQTNLTVNGAQTNTGALTVDGGVTTTNEVTIDGKFAVTGLDAVTAWAIDRGTGTNNGTPTFTAVFGAGAVSVTYSWTDAITSASTGLVADVTANTTNFLFDAPTVDVTNFSWIAVGARP